MLYTPYHEMDVRQFADKMNELYRAAKPETNLKSLRTLAEMSQSELARQAEIPVRTISNMSNARKTLTRRKGKPCCAWHVSCIAV